jgi:hypothetical protein
MSARKFKEGDRVVTELGEPATIYVLHPNGTHAVLTMTDQFMKDGGQALRTVDLATLKKVTS